MRNGITFRKTLTSGCSLKTCIIIGLSCYVALLGIIELTHDHHDHAEQGHSAEACAACFYISQHIAIEVEPFVIISSFKVGSIVPFFETIFLVLRFTIKTWSRAPPVFSNQFTSFAC